MGKHTLLPPKLLISDQELVNLEKVGRSSIIDRFFLFSFNRPRLADIVAPELDSKRVITALVITGIGETAKVERHKNTKNWMEKEQDE